MKVSPIGPVGKTDFINPAARQLDVQVGYELIGAMASVVTMFGSAKGG